MEILFDHMHIFVSAKSTVAPTDIIRTLKSISSIIFKQNEKLKLFYGKCGSWWSKGYFISTVGNISEKTVKKYISILKDEFISKEAN